MHSFEPTKEAVDAQVAQDKELGLDPDEYVISGNHRLVVPTIQAVDAITP